MFTFCVIEFSDKLTYLCSVQDIPSAVRGFYYYRKYWQPQLDDELCCQQKLENPFDFFAIKICIKNVGVTLGHLQMEIPRATRFLLDRGATAFIKLYSTNYCVSSLVQGGLEIPCLVEIQMPPTLKNREIIYLYKSMIDLSYDSREKDFVVWLFLSTNEEIEITLAACSSSASKKKKIGKENSQHEKSDIPSFFHVTSVLSSTPRRDDTDIEIVKLSLLMTKK